jgi:tRNA(fMet)-specific endonuclease VapC
MKTVLVDTDILIDFLRGREKAKSYLLSLLEGSTIYCSVISIAEIHAGMKEHEREKTIELIDSLNIVDVTRDIAEKAGEYKREGKKQFLELDDCFVAATAFVKGAILATGNGKHYPMEDIKKEIFVF